MGRLARNGHVPALVAAFAGALGLKPLIRLRGGEAVPAGVATGADQVMDAMLVHLEKRCRRALGFSDRPARLLVGVMHAGAPERGQSARPGSAAWAR